MIFADVGGIICHCNDAATRVFGYREEGIVGRSLDVLIPERFRGPHAKGYVRAISERLTKYAEKVLATRSVRSDGSRITVEMAIAVLLDTDGHVSGVLAQIRDITDRFEKERQAKNQLAG